MDIMFRLNIDCPLGEDLDRAKELTQNFIAQLKDLLGHAPEEFNEIQYRLSKDEDRQVRNYMIENENGHVSTKKSELF